MIRGRAPHDGRRRLHHGRLSEARVLAALGRRRLGVATFRMRVVVACDGCIVGWSTVVRRSITHVALSVIRKIATAVIPWEVVDTSPPALSSSSAFMLVMLPRLVRGVPGRLLLGRLGMGQISGGLLR